MLNLLFLLTLVTSFSIFSMQTAEAASKFEKMKTMYEQATAPDSEAQLLARAEQANSCAEVKSSAPNQSIPESLVVVSYKLRGSGPEFPDQMLEGLGFGYAGVDPESFFKDYKKNLSSSDFSIEYGYSYFESSCNDNPDGSTYCNGGYYVLLAADAQFRVSKDYLHYKKAPDTYGYCWKTN